MKDELLPSERLWAARQFKSCSSTYDGASFSDRIKIKKIFLSELKCLPVYWRRRRELEEKLRISSRELLEQGQKCERLNKRLNSPFSYILIWLHIFGLLKINR